MKLIARAVPLVSTVLLVVGLAGCAAGHGMSAHRHAGMGGTGGMDMQSHCEMHKKMMAGKSPAEQQAMMQDHMKSMTPEMRQRMQSMHEQCK
jgi:Spy/CpxP family protein refolding chaperone